MTKQEFIKELSGRAFISYTNTTDVVNVLSEVILTELKKNGECPLPGLGKLILTHRSERTGRNPKTGESLIVPASTGIKFKPIAAVKEAIQ